jgi:hypothetical protein
MLFAYERLRAFPIDVWIERVLRQHYFLRGRKMSAQRLRQFSETYFGEHGGYAQQYLFHHARMSSRRSGCPGLSRQAGCQPTTQKARQAARLPSQAGQPDLQPKLSAPVA